MWCSKCFLGFGEAGAGRVIFLSDEEREIQYAHGLGTSTNNQAEYLALWQGLELALSKEIRHLMVFGDSVIVIQQVSKFKPPFCIE